MTARREGRTVLTRAVIVDLVHEQLEAILAEEKAAELANTIVAELEGEGVHVDGWVPQ